MIKEMNLFTVKQLIRDYNIGNAKTWAWITKNSLELFDIAMLGKKVLFIEDIETIKSKYCYAHAYFYYPATSAGVMNSEMVEWQMLEKYKVKKYDAKNN